jgi:hypothetical protein
MKKSEGLMFDTIPGVTFQVSCTRPMLPYIAKFFLPFIPSHPLANAVEFCQSGFKGGTRIKFEQKYMRGHLVHCLEKGNF